VQLPSASLTEAALARLDHLISEAKHGPEGNAALLMEHLHSARVYLLGAMPDEYRCCLLEARQLATHANGAPQQALAQEIAELVKQIPEAAPQIDGAPPRRPERESLGDSDKSDLYRFFQGSATTLGVFYPTHYIFASFQSMQDAKNAAKTLQAAGFVETHAASSAETFRFLNEVQAEVGLWGALMASISRFFGTEEVFADIDLAKVEEGGAFLAVYCRREEHAERIHDLVIPFEPTAMQLYLPGGIRSLVAGKSPGPQGNHPQQN